MARTKGSKNKVVVTECPAYVEVDTSVELSTMDKKNPLIGYTMEEINGFIREVNPTCGRGGCLHDKFQHIKNEKGQMECHKCNCMEFIG